MLEEEKAALEAERNDAVTNLQAMEDTEQGVILQYQRLVQILKAREAQDMNTVVTVYSDMDRSLITDEVSMAAVAELESYMETEGYQILADLGNGARDGGNQDAALDFYQKSLNVKGDNPQVIYDMAMIYQAKEERDQANELFGQVIMNYPNTELANLAKAARGY